MAGFGRDLKNGFAVLAPFLTDSFLFTINGLNPLIKIKQKSACQLLGGMLRMGTLKRAQTLNAKKNHGVPPLNPLFPLWLARSHSHFYAPSLEA